MQQKKKNWVPHKIAKTINFLPFPLKDNTWNRLIASVLKKSQALNFQFSTKSESFSLFSKQENILTFQQAGRQKLTRWLWSGSHLLQESPDDNIS